MTKTLTPQTIKKEKTLKQLGIQLPSIVDLETFTKKQIKDLKTILKAELPEYEKSQGLKLKPTKIPTVANIKKFTRMEMYKLTVRQLQSVLYGGDINEKIYSDRVREIVNGLSMKQVKKYVKQVGGNSWAPHRLRYNLMHTLAYDGDYCRKTFCETNGKTLKILNRLLTYGELKALKKKKAK